MKSFYLQKGIVEWFRAEPNSKKTLQAMQTVCVKLLAQISYNEGANYRYEIIYPLLKLGVIEYYNDNYRLSPSCAIHKGSNVLFCNIPHITEAETPLHRILDTGLGIEVYESNRQSKLYLQQLGLTSSPFSLLQLLQNISLSGIVNEWPLVKVLETSGYFFLTNNGWQPAKNVSPGIYKTGKEIYAKRLLMMSDGNWRSISTNWNDFALAVLWTKIQNNERLHIQYSKKDGLIDLNKEYFPLLLERLLLLNTFLTGKSLAKYNHRQYYISSSEFAILNTIFKNRISII
jgi:hypothetical protein